jgi:hypothetical protein
MRGPIAEVQALAKATIAEIGVEHGFAHFIPIEGDHHHHHHE